MQGSLDSEFKSKLKQLIINECEIDTEIDTIDDNGPIFGSDSQLGLDSIDVFQLAIAIQTNYGVKITDSKEMQRVLRSINTFADYLQPE
jgi:acyl carrier protein